MHTFSELVQQSTAFTLSAIRSAQQSLIDKLQNNADTPLIKALQMIELQRVISAVGMFSMFDAVLQEELQCPNGFQKAEELLKSVGDEATKNRFCNLKMAINVLKHGKGPSYNALVKIASLLPFKVKLPSEALFCEGNTSEALTLIEVDDEFVKLCAEVIHEVSVAIEGIPNKTL